MALLRGTWGTRTGITGETDPALSHSLPSLAVKKSVIFSLYDLLGEGTESQGLKISTLVREEMGSSRGAGGSSW
jgi:hypothetical protein